MVLGTHFSQVFCPISNGTRDGSGCWLVKHKLFVGSCWPAMELRAAAGQQMKCGWLWAVAGPLSWTPVFVGGRAIK